jgi:hypothetical protein
MATNGEWFPDRPGPLTKLAETVPQDMSRPGGDRDRWCGQVDPHLLLATVLFSASSTAVAE